MAVSHYFNNFSSHKINEQRLYEDIIVESIRMNGHDVWYMPREDWDTTDEILGENIHSKFERAYQMEMYLANVEGFEGDSEFFSKFGLEIRDTSNFVVAKRTFDKYMPSTIAIRPREGDLLYIPTFQKIFEIKFVEEELMFFTRGKRLPYIYELRAEAFRYANEEINTGVDEIDQIEKQSSYIIQLTTSGNGSFWKDETVYQGATFATATATARVADWIPANNILQIYEVKGDFSTSGTVKGATSNTTRTIITKDDMGDYTYYDLYNNKELQLESNNFVDLTEINPFGTP